MNIPFNDALALLSACMPYLIASAVFLFKHLESRLPANAQYHFDQIVETVVAGVEQKSGADKKAQAVAAVSGIAKDLGWKWVSPTLVDLAIEAAVHAMNQTTPTPEAQPQAAPVPAV